MPFLQEKKAWYQRWTGQSGSGLQALPIKTPAASSFFASTYVELCMTRDRELSPAAWTLLEFLAETPDEWGYGYDIVRFSGIKSGTLYPLLIRLEARGLLEAEWQPAQSPGRPPRHGYRIANAGLALVRQNQADKQVHPSLRLDPLTS